MPLSKDNCLISYAGKKYAGKKYRPTKVNASLEDSIFSKVKRHVCLGIKYA